jgi:hypothetical protein
MFRKNNKCLLFLLLAMTTKHEYVFIAFLVSFIIAFPFASIAKDCTEAKTINEARTCIEDQKRQLDNCLLKHDRLINKICAPSECVTKDGECGKIEIWAGTTHELGRYHANDLKPDNPVEGKIYYSNNRISINNNYIAVRWGCVLIK